MKLDYGYRLDGAKDLMGSMGNIYVLQLIKHIDTLEKMGASEDQIAVELAGHAFHEAVHQGENGLDEALLNKKRPLGEVTSITSQLAYYLMRGYNGPKSYDNSFFEDGIKKIYNGENSVSEHNVATCVSHELLLEQLVAFFPEIADSIESKTSLDACEEIVAKIPQEKRDSLIPALKEAIFQSTDREKFNEVIKKLREKQDGKN
jgi:hypothetical protein